MRSLRPILVGLLLLAVPACASNNKGKIVGKWLVTGGTAIPPNLPAGAQIVMEFKSDGTFAWSATADGNSQTFLTGDYVLGMGDNVTWKNLNVAISGQKTHLEKIHIAGDTMTIADQTGNLTLKRM